MVGKPKARKKKSVPKIIGYRGKGQISIVSKTRAGVLASAKRASQQHGAKDKTGSTWVSLKTVKPF